MARPAARDEPLLSARFDPALTRVHLVCSPLLAVGGRFHDPLRYRDDELVDELCRTFRARATQEGYA